VLNACPYIAQQKHVKKVVSKHASEHLFIICKHILEKEEEREKNLK
jgi:hypothetical protein